MGIGDITTPSRHQFCSRGGLPRLDNPVWSGVLSFGGGPAVGCTERDPPHSSGVSNHWGGRGARGIRESPELSIQFFVQLPFSRCLIHCLCLRESKEGGGYACIHTYVYLAQRDILSICTSITCRYTPLFYITEGEKFDSSQNHLCYV